ELLPFATPAAELVVGRALLGILERLVGLGDLLEFLLALRILRDVGMVFLRELAIRLLDRIRARAALHPEDGVVILVFHACRENVSGTIFGRVIVSEPRLVDDPGSDVSLFNPNSALEMLLEEVERARP